MEATYDFFETHEINDTETVQQYRARLISSGSVTTEDIAEIIQERSTFNRADVMGLLEALTEVTLARIERGYTVQIGRLGTLSMSLSSEKVKDKHSIRAESVYFNGLHFKASSYATDKLKHLTAHRSEQKKERSILKREERTRVVMHYLQKNQWITIREYAKLTGLSRRAAQQDMQQYVANKELSKKSVGKMFVYMLL
ncbi:MAG: hypothetical protein WCQ82_05265 [Bacteroidaceae bacterium]|nr:hypothetical protein [Bacteroidaceae bacterium]